MQLDDQLSKWDVWETIWGCCRCCSPPIPIPLQLSPRASWYIIGLHLLLVRVFVDMGASWLHGVCKEDSLAPSIRRLRLPLYRTCGDNSVLFDHYLERMEGWFATNADTISLKYWYKVLKLQLVAAS